MGERHGTAVLIGCKAVRGLICIPGNSLGPFNEPVAQKRAPHIYGMERPGLERLFFASALGFFKKKAF